MDHKHFDTLARSLIDKPTRRSLLRGLAGLGLSLGVARLPHAAAARKKRKNRNEKQHEGESDTTTGKRPGKDEGRKDPARPDDPPCLRADDGCNPGECGPCHVRKRGRCFPLPDGKPCEGGICQDGVCQPQVPTPTCEETCAGCCYDGQCYPGDTNANCGKNGALCTQCASDEWCTPVGVCGPPPTCGNGGSCLVFVTSAEFPGNLGGLDGADAICQQLAQTNSLPGTYRAWLSDESGSPSTRFAQSSGPYVLRNGTVVANDWADLTDGPLLAPIEITEEHNAVVGGRTWTNTDANGTPLLSNQKHCHNWTSADGPFIGQWGRAFASNAEWTDSGKSSPCAQSAHLYCFQQS